MTTTYLIHAWCNRPFIAYVDVEAETPMEAIAIARGQTDKLLDTAEECDGKYPWDEFAAYDEGGKELLHVRDEEAGLPDAASLSPILMVSVRGGLIEDLEATIPITVVVENWDVPDENTGKKPTQCVHGRARGMSATKTQKLRRLITHD